MQDMEAPLPITNGMNYEYAIRSGSLPLLVAVVLTGSAAGASAFVSKSMLQGSRLPSVPFPTSITVNEPLRGTAAVIYDPSTGTMLFAQNEEMQLPLASLAKLMTASAVLQSEEPSRSVRITAADLQPSGDSGLKPGELWNIGELVKFGMVASSNDAIAAAASSAGSQAILGTMNEYAKTLGLAQTYFLDPTGLDLTPETAGAYGSARDMAILTAAFLKAHPEALEVTVHNAVNVGPRKGGTMVADSTSVPIHDIPGLVGAKTGYTLLAGGNLVAVFDADIGRPIVAVVLHSSEEGRFEDMRVLIDAVRTSVTAAASR